MTKSDGANPTWSQACEEDDVWPGEMYSTVVGDTEILVINVDGEPQAFEDLCPHAERPLSDGLLEGYTLTCAAHSWSFDVRRGSGINPVAACLKRFALKVEDKVIYVDPGTVLQEARNSARRESPV